MQKRLRQRDVFIRRLKEARQRLDISQTAVGIAAAVEPSVASTRFNRYVKRGELFKIDLQLIQDNQKRHNGELFKIKSAVV